MRTKTFIVWLLLGLLAVLIALGLFYRGQWLAEICTEGTRRRVMGASEYEQWARTRFYGKFPGEKPLNWLIADMTVCYYKEQPMGKFVLEKNDCSDFVDCLVDDAMGPGARFRRDSQEHVVMRRGDVFKSFYWQRGVPVIPGDIVSVRHSPWYPPKESTLRHVGVVGADSQVYDFVKLKSWSAARYGRNSFPWFVRHSPDQREVIIYRLHPRYRYRAVSLPWEK